MQEQASRISLCLTHPEAKLEVRDALSHEVLATDLARFACVRQLNQSTEGTTHWRTKQQHWLFIANALLSLFHLLLITHVPACPRVHYEAALEVHADGRVSATLKSAGATPSDTRTTANSLIPIDASAGVRLGSSGKPISSDPRFLDGNTSSIRLLSPVESSRGTSNRGLTFLALLAADASLSLLVAGWSHCLMRAWAASTLVATDCCSPAGETRCSAACNLCWPTASFIIACLMRSRHPSLCGFVSAPIYAIRHPSQSSENPYFASSTSRRM